jgi:serine/threonine protein kinase/TolB-like protein/Tfp pilus assembly protein PilF
MIGRSDMTLPAGSRLGPYEILAPIGAGGMGEVYRARDARLARDVAVKVLPPRFSSDTDRLRRFEKEARSVSALNHPNILTIHDIGMHEGSPFIVSELLQGETLRVRMGGAALPSRKAMDYGSQIARGLAAAHEKGIVHRDLKPENLFVTSDGRVKILDFGLAKLAHPESEGAGRTDAPTMSSPTEPGVVMGTVGYMSPEQVRGATVDSRCDIFSLGAVLYEMATGERAFARASSVESLNAILKEDPPDFGRDVPLLPSAVALIVRRCLEKQPGERFQSAQDLAFALQSAMETAPSLQGSGSIAASPLSRPRLVRRVAVAAAVLAVVVAAIFVSRRSPPDRAPPGGASKLEGAPAEVLRSIAVLPFVNMSGSKENEYLGDGISEEVINVLARDGHLQVVSRTSAFAFKGQNVDAREIGKRLNAESILEGSVRQAGNQLRVTAQLINTANGYHVWSQTFDRKASDILAIQDEISRTIVEKLDPSASKVSAAGSAPTANLEAYDLYLRGRYAMSVWEKDALRLAEGNFEKAVVLDPDFGAAWATLAETVIMQHEIYGVRERDEAYAKAADAARRALAVSRPAAEGHAALAHILGHHGKWKSAEDEAKLAIEGNPGAAVGHEWLGWILWYTGRFSESEKEFRRALALDPLSGPYHLLFGGCLLSAGKYAEAVAPLERAAELGEKANPAFEPIALVHLKRYDDAIRAIGRLGDALENDPTVEALRAYVHAAAGRKKEAASLLSKVETRIPSADTDVYPLVALAHAAMDEREPAILWFQKSGRSAYDELGWMRFLPEVRPFLADPRMQAILRDAGYLD